MITLKQGESFRIYINLTQDGMALVPELIDDIMFCIGGDFNKSYSGGGVRFDTASNRWYIFPTQEETVNMNPGRKTLDCHIKYLDGTVIIRDLDTVKVERSSCQEVF